jgi:hypothetical protein
MPRNYAHVIVGLVLCCAAQAQVGVIDPARVPTPEIRHPALSEFSMSQRAAIYDAVVRDSATPVLPLDIEVKVGTVLPESIQIAPIPQSVLTNIPAARTYGSVVWGDQVLLVKRDSRIVADILRGYILRDQGR